MHNPINNTLNHKSIIDLCDALSEIFIDNEVDYEYIAETAKHFPIGLVEYILFEWVAPICYTNLETPIPSIWSGFNRNKLWQDIMLLRSQQRKNNLKIKFRRHYIRQQYKADWNTLKNLLILNK